MTDKGSKDVVFQELRKKAQQIVGERQETNAGIEGADLDRLITELEVYQVEVELQNQELRRTTKDLENARNEWFELFDTAPVGFIILDQSGAIERCNRIAAGLLSGSRQSMGSRSFLSRVHPDDREAYLLFRRALERDGGTLFRELRLVKENDQIVYVHIEARAEKDAHGEFSRCRLALVDISERKAYEKDLKNARQELENRVQERTAELTVRNRQLARLTSELTLAEQRERKRLAELLHDHLQQILAGARLHLEILAGETGMADKPAYKSAHALINESLQMSRSLSSELSPPVLYQNGLPEAMQWLTRWMAATHRLDVDLDLTGDFPFIREEHRVLLFHSVRELLFNVVKHADTSRAWLAMQEKNGRVRISVSDKGRGCDPDHWKMDGPDTGFGLFIIRERLELLGGDLEIASEPNAGTTVTIFLPIDSTDFARPEPSAPTLDEPEKAAEQPENPPSAGEEIRVMLVDDHSVMRKGLFSFLSSYEDIEIVGEAENGEEAVEKARQIFPDVILMDINMPRMNGVEATRRITSENPGIRIYGLSMYDTEDQGHAMAEAGAAGYLSKSGNSDALIAAIRGG